MRFGIKVWYAIYNNKLIGPIFYNGIFISAWYLQLLQNIMPNFLVNLTVFYLRSVWFQHDGAPVHKTFPVKQYIVTEFGKQIIGYGGVEEWPPRFSDLTPLDFFLWSYLKQLVYATSPQTLQNLKWRIKATYANVSPSVLRHVQCEIQTRIQMCIAADGAKFEHLK